MKKATNLTALAALLISTDPNKAKVQYPLFSYEVDGGFYSNLGMQLSSVIPGVRVTVRAHGPRMAELYGVSGSLNHLGLHVRPSRELTPLEMSKLQQTVKFYLQNVTLHRTVKTNGKNRMELRQNTEFVKVTKAYSVALIQQFVVAFGTVKK
jgi:hypothetical protein